MARNSDLSFGAKVFVFSAAGIGSLLVMAALFCGGVVLEGWVITRLWEWFVVPQFGVAQISIAYAIGLSLVLSLLAYTPSVTRAPGEEASFSAGFGVTFVRPLLALLVGWVVHTYFIWL